MKTLFFITTRRYNFIGYCITKITNKESLNDLSVDVLAGTLEKHVMKK